MVRFAWLASGFPAVAFGGDAAVQRAVLLGEAVGGAGCATDNAIAGYGVGGVEGQGMDDTVVDAVFGGYKAVRCSGRNCWGVNSCASDNLLTSRGIWGGHGSVLVVLPGDRQLCNR